MKEQPVGCSFFLPACSIYIQELNGNHTFAPDQKIPVVLYPVHQNPRFDGQKLILILSVHKNRYFRGQERHKAGGASRE